MFLSDGKPSDHATMALSGPDFEIELTRHLVVLCGLGPNFTFGALGYAAATEDMTCLEEMISFASSYGIRCFFHRGLKTGALRNSVSTLTTSLNYSRTLLSSLGPPLLSSSATRTRRTSRDKEALSQDATGGDNVMAGDWEIYTQRDHLRTTRYVIRGIIQTVPSYTCVHRLQKKGSKYEWTDNDALVNPVAAGIAVQKDYFSEGAERMVMRMTEITATGSPIGTPLVAKTSAYVEDDGACQVKFHRLFVRTQQQAARIAKRFNQTLDRLQVDPTVPRMSFLPCTIYLVTLSTGGEWGYLAEKRLDHRRYVL